MGPINFAIRDSTEKVVSIRCRFSGDGCVWDGKQHHPLDLTTWMVQFHSCIMGDIDYEAYSIEKTFLHSHWRTDDRAHFLYLWSFSLWCVTNFFFPSGLSSYSLCWSHVAVIYGNNNCWFPLARKWPTWKRTWIWIPYGKIEKKCPRYFIRDSRGNPRDLNMCRTGRSAALSRGRKSMPPRRVHETGRATA